MNAASDGLTGRCGGSEVEILQPPKLELRSTKSRDRLHLGSGHRQQSLGFDNV